MAIVYQDMEDKLREHIDDIDTELRYCDNDKLKAKLLLAKSTAMQAAVHYQINR